MRGIWRIITESAKNTSTVGNANDYCSKNNPDKVLPPFSAGAQWLFRRMRRGSVFLRGGRYMWVSRGFGGRRGVNRFIAVFQRRNYCSGFPSADIRPNPAVCVWNPPSISFVYLAECFHSFPSIFSPVSFYVYIYTFFFRVPKEKHHTESKSLTIDWVMVVGI